VYVAIAAAVTVLAVLCGRETRGKDLAAIEERTGRQEQPEDASAPGKPAVA
jgi:hypothetical protein